MGKMPEAQNFLIPPRMIQRIDTSTNPDTHVLIMSLVSFSRSLDQNSIHLNHAPITQVNTDAFKDKALVWPRLRIVIYE